MTPVPMTDEDATLALKFMERVDLKGAEVYSFTRAVNLLRAIAQKETLVVLNEVKDTVDTAADSA